jgi:hypothetical protein
MLILTILILSTLDLPGGATEEKAGIITVKLKNKTLTEIKHVYFSKQITFIQFMSTADIQKEQFGFPRQPGESFPR